MIDQTALARISEFSSELVEFRRDLHAHPELGTEEVRTSARVAELLESWGVDVTTHVGGHGLVGTIHGSHSGNRYIGIRADMDALPIREETGLPYASRTEGVMHACGHDGHTAILLGAARYLAESRDFAGDVHVIFQPAEEGLGGANAMLSEGLFDRFPCDAVYGLHVAPGLPAGMVAIGSGPVMAATGEFDVRFTGTGGHGGLATHRSADLCLVQAQFVSAAHSIVARDVPADQPAVLSVCFISAGNPTSHSVLPAQAHLGGSFRALSEPTQQVLDKRIAELASNIAGAFGCSAAVETKWTHGPVINPPDQAARVVTAARAALGRDKVLDQARPVMAGEDFACMLEAKPGTFVFLGNGLPADGVLRNIHNSRFDFNDDALVTGVSLWVSLVQQELDPRLDGH